MIDEDCEFDKHVLADPYRKLVHLSRITNTRSTKSEPDIVMHQLVAIEEEDEVCDGETMVIPSTVYGTTPFLATLIELGELE